METNNKARWDAVLTVVLVTCALITTGLVLRRELFSPATTSPQAATQKPVYIDDWRAHLRRGVTLGSPDAPVQLIEFADFECPFCASFHGTIETVRERYPTQIALTYIHYPIPGHRFAEPAARVAECAGEQGRFEAMHARLYKGQDQFGLKPWSEFATDAGVPDLATFGSCIQKTDPLQSVIEGRELAEQLNVRGTPTVIVNGWQLARPPSATELDAMVKAILDGKSPV
ncbi:MAG: thioredoxin domain-containing protein [Steroidobacter sp.]